MDDEKMERLQRTAVATSDALYAVIRVLSPMASEETVEALQRGEQCRRDRDRLHSQRETSPGR